MMTREEIVARVGSGWTAIVNEALDKIWAINPDVLVMDCKEWVGTLRLYLGLIPIKQFDAVYDIVREAERVSRLTCEECGSPGKIRRDLSWIRAMCDAHYLKARG